MSIVRICDDGFTAIFTAKETRVAKEGKIVLEGQREGAMGMW